MATHSSILAWKNPWTEESSGLKSMGLHDWACVHEGGGRWVGSNKLVELKKKKCGRHILHHHDSMPPYSASKRHNSTFYVNGVFSPGKLQHLELKLSFLSMCSIENWPTVISFASSVSSMRIQAILQWNLLPGYSTEHWQSSKHPKITQNAKNFFL